MIVLYIIIALLAIVLITAVFKSDTYTIIRDISISKPQATVFDFIKLIKNQEHYNKWVMADPNLRKTLTGTDGTVGFIYAWDSDNKQVGKGEQEITAIDGSNMDTEVRFIKPFEGLAHTSFKTEALSANETKVTWVMNGNKNYMAKLMHMLLNLGKVLGNDMQTSLNTLKTVLEK
ncbi:polyketide cyclase [Mucilaginibacter sp. PPCGB 2223]|uniref:SRPBCC family protein n=1 Tax=Mucilaginibacter sp. PPCGB 2223 TaxID=1886027 RepID=UPI000826AFE3|nr:SRPBCC family protein [Mucilaginibacter sp. PPCGB 2223]OCX52333.1 polyketide cyclase [Mucilaginibacter sp. PPCGB 2223]